MIDIPKNAGNKQVAFGSESDRKYGDLSAARNICFVRLFTGDRANNDPLLCFTVVTFHTHTVPYPFAEPVHIRHLISLRGCCGGNFLPCLPLGVTKIVVIPMPCPQKNPPVIFAHIALRGDL